MKQTSTSWGGVADWYDRLLGGKGTFQSDVILPHLVRLLDLKKGEQVLDLACGPGFFSREWYKLGASVVGVDIAPELIELARKQVPKATFHVSSADDLSMLADHSIDDATCILAIQNIQNVGGVFKEVARVLRPGGRLALVMNHPSFRVPQKSGWGWDETSKVQYRRVDGYLSESKVKIDMHPGQADAQVTISFHRPLQFYVKALSKAHLSVTRLEEWTSHKVSDSGPRAAAENRARKEIPLFMYLEATK